MSKNIQYPKVIVDEYTSPIDAHVEPESSIEDCQKLIQENGYRHLPVQLGEDVVGIISQRDVNLYFNFTNSQGRVLLVKDIMRTQPFVVNFDEPLEKVVFALSEKKIGSALVRDEAGKVTGIFTTTDAMNALIELLHSTKLS